MQDKFDQEYRRSKKGQERADRERFYAAYDLAEAIRLPREHASS